MPVIKPALIVLVALALAVGCGDSTTTTVIQQPPTTQTTNPGGTAAETGGDCGEIAFSGTPTTIVVLRGVECSEAVRIATAYGASTAPSPWNCSLAHEPFDSYPLPDGSNGIVGFSCGHGGAAGDLRASPNAFIGVAPERPAPAPPAAAAPIDCGPTGSFTTLSVRNMTCEEAGSKNFSVTPPGEFNIEGFTCRAIEPTVVSPDGSRLGTYRCTQGNKAMRFVWEGGDL